MTEAATPAAWAPTCRCCLAWQANPHSGLFAPGCDDCQARALAQTPAAWRAVKGETAVDLQDAILRVFGEDRYKAGRALVWAWMRRLKIGGKAS